MMQRLFAWLLALGLLGYAGVTAYRYLLPCNRPVLYHAGTLDPRFHISDAAFHQAMTDAAAQWNASGGRELFREDPAGFPVSAVYDERQKAADALKELGIELDEGEQSYQDVKARYESVKKTFDAQAAAYAKAGEDFDRRKKDFAARLAVAEADGFTPEESAVFAKEAQSINAFIPQLQAQGKTLEEKRTELNGIVSVLNTLAARQNESIETFNTIGQSVGAEYEAGVFVRENGKERIDVFAFDDVSELQSLLLHEFGHALGLQHTEDPQSIMYRLHTGENSELTETDRMQMVEVCKW